VLLVLLHVLAPGVHALQHALGLVHGPRGRGPSATAACACGHVHGPRPSAAPGRANAPYLTEGEARSEPCSLCADLQRSRGYQPVAVELSTMTEVAAPLPRRELVAAPSVSRVAVPPVRGPPV